MSYILSLVSNKKDVRETKYYGHDFFAALYWKENSPSHNRVAKSKSKRQSLESLLSNQVIITIY